MNQVIQLDTKAITAKEKAWIDRCSEFERYLVLSCRIPKSVLEQQPRRPTAEQFKMRRGE